MKRIIEEIDIWYYKNIRLGFMVWWDEFFPIFYNTVMVLMFLLILLGFVSICADVNNNPHKWLIIMENWHPSE